MAAKTSRKRARKSVSTKRKGGLNKRIKRVVLSLEEKKYKTFKLDPSAWVAPIGDPGTGIGIGTAQLTSSANNNSPIAYIEIGTNVDQRIGNRIRVQKIQWTGCLMPVNNAGIPPSGQMFRLLMVLDKACNNGSGLDANTILDGAANFAQGSGAFMTNPFNIELRKRFQVLFDKMITFPTTIVAQCCWNETIRINKEFIFDGTSKTTTDLSKNDIQFWLIPMAGWTAITQFRLQTILRVFFTDD